ncbi:MAG TPA: DUF882 domain-containing protein [Caulobacteraceae bacterium]|jgi:uncharacterized protein YcbK (DUF882 family)|nr:DUF882 domain-containing protein [Caulobacteraceae bacterium]
MDIARRSFLGLSAGAGLAALAGANPLGRSLIEIPPARRAAAAPSLRAAIPPAPSLPADIRRAFLHNLHTGETLDAVYWEAGKYVPDALAEAMRVMRDWRNGQEHAMDPRLFDLLHAIQARLEVNRPFQLISGYRSPATNAALHAESGEVAAHSQHLLGKASDIRVEGVELDHLHRAALSLKAGGVGFYPVSNFVHVDVAAVRQWSGT